MNIKPIRTKTDYRAALQDIDSLMTAKAKTPDGDRLDVLVTLVEAYERTHFPMDLPDAVDAIKFRMEQQNLAVEDLEPVIGRRNRVYEVLARKRPLTLRMIEGLHAKLGIPAESLLKQGVRKTQSRAARDASVATQCPVHRRGSVSLTRTCVSAGERFAGECEMQVSSQQIR